MIQGPASCAACGALASAGQRFCGQCGAELRRLCPACQSDNPPDHRFCGGCGAALEPAVQRAQPTLKASSSAREERRWVSVLFADLSGFTAMSERMDPEDVKVLADRCAERLSQEVRRYGGTVINVVGDGVVAVFGAPQAHEDDAERAVRAALAMRDCSLSDDPTRPVRVHVSVNTGEVMAGLTGPEERRDYTVMGDTVNTAARLLAAAAVGCVLVGEETYRATRHVVHYRELPPITAKGKELPVRAWEAQESAAIPLQRPLGTAPFLGRDQELEQLLASWERVVREGQPQLVTILGEPGIGKSRLVAEFERRLPGEVMVLHGRCLPYGEALSYWALAMLLKEAAGISAEESAETARAKLSALVERVSAPDAEPDEAAELARHLALLSGLDLAADREGGSPDQRTLHSSARRLLEALALRQPLCMIVDDLHWADQALMDLLEYSVSRISHAPLLMIAQARPELLEKRPAWGRSVRSFSSLSLAPIAEHQERELIMALCRERGLSEQVAEQVGRGPGGNPLFAEEMVALIAERGQAAGVPSLIKLLLMARLDALPAAEGRVIQLASVFGRVFWEGGLRALEAGSVGDLAAHLDTLQGKDLIRAQPASQFRGEREYSFKHQLIRDVAYEMLPRTERRRLHGQAADWLAQRADRRAEEFFDLLAHHAVEAGQQQRAVTYLMLAAERAGRAAAHQQEAALLGQALPLATALGQQGLIAELHTRRGRAYSSLGLWSDAGAEFEAALALLAPGQQQQRVELLVDLTTVRFWTMDIPGLRRDAQAALALAEQLGRQDLTAAALAGLAMASASDGQLAQSQEYYQRALEADVSQPAPGLVFGMAMWPLALHWMGRTEEAIAAAHRNSERARSRHDTTLMMFNLPHLGLALAGSGRYGEALQVFEQSQQFGRDHEIWPLLARTTAMAAGFHLDVFDFIGNEALAEEARELGRRSDFTPPVVSASLDLLFNFIRRQELGRAERLIGELAEIVERASAFHGWLWRIRFTAAQAELALARGQWDEAVRWADSAVEQSQLRRRPKYQIIALETRALALAALGQHAQPRADLEQAIRLARSLDAPALLLRPAAALLPISDDEQLADETRLAIRQIAAALPTEQLRRSFEAAEPVQRMAALLR